MPCDFEIIKCAMPGNFVCRRCKKCGHEIGLPVSIAETRWAEIYETIKNNCELRASAQPPTSAMPIQGTETAEQNATGPGAQLKKMLAKINIHATPTCACNARARYMDFMGVLWCEKNTDIIIDWLREEAEKRGLPFIELAAKILVNRAIALARRARKNGRK